jgi:hypothetical protein
MRAVAQQSCMAFARCGALQLETALVILWAGMRMGTGSAFASLLHKSASSCHNLQHLAATKSGRKELAKSGRNKLQNLAGSKPRGQHRWNPVAIDPFQ